MLKEAKAGRGTVDLRRFGTKLVLATTLTVIWGAVLTLVVVLLGQLAAT